MVQRGEEERRVDGIGGDDQPLQHTLPQTLIDAVDWIDGVECT